ncbi:MAG: NAD(P)/FAD-dependent oxidoreductase [Clostridia bacterium]|nr:NAD(P)/FAD-dependent oxidoreductase [Clostridia bacterium]
MSMTKKGTDVRRVAVIGAGAAGMMAAITAAEAGASVTLFERNDRVGKKLRITGKGRCNVTNNCDNSEFLSNVPTNPRFLYASLSRFSTADTVAFFESAGVPLKTERGKRVFPISDRAADIVSAMERRCREAGVEIVHRRVRGLIIDNGRIVGLRYGENEDNFDAVIVCTGGRSYSMTGSDGDGYRFATEAGHTVTPLYPSLVPIVAEGKLCASLQGLSLKNVSLSIKMIQSGKTVYEDFGEMLFTHYGLTGPLVLSASAHLSDITPGKYEAVIDLKPALDEKTLDARILSDFSKYQNRDLINALDDLLPQKMIAPYIGLCGIDPRKKVNSITREEREKMVQVLKGIHIKLVGFRPIEEAIVTRGGVSVKEVDPKTMQSKLVEGLYFAGEVLDVDAYTGGFNLQIAFSTATVAGSSAAWG